MTCPRFDDLDDEALLRHLEACTRCSGLSGSDAVLADSLVAAAAAAGRFREARRRAAAGLLAASLLAVALLSFQLVRRPEPRPGFVLEGDETGIVLTGPDLVRRSESLPPLSPAKGDRT